MPEVPEMCTACVPRRVRRTVVYSGNAAMAIDRPVSRTRTGTDPPRAQRLRSSRTSYDSTETSGSRALRTVTTTRLVLWLRIPQMRDSHGDEQAASVLTDPKLCAAFLLAFVLR